MLRRRQQNSQFHLKNATDFPNFMGPGLGLKYKKKSLHIQSLTKVLLQPAKILRFSVQMSDILFCTVYLSEGSLFPPISKMCCNREREWQKEIEYEYI